LGFLEISRFLENNGKFLGVLEKAFLAVFGFLFDTQVAVFFSWVETCIFLDTVAYMIHRWVL
jgi:hypothetical protein